MKEIELLRENVYHFVKLSIIPNVRSGNTLEIAPAVKKYSPIERWFIDIKDYAESYMSCDNDPETNPNILCDILDIQKYTDESFDTIVCLEVVEHVSRFWELPKLFYDLLNPGGKLFLSTPFYFLWHDPRPDYWRLSKDGLDYLFSPYFDLQIESLNLRNDDGRKPIHHTLIGNKK